MKHLWITLSDRRARCERCGLHRLANDLPSNRIASGYLVDGWWVADEPPCPGETYWRERQP